MLAVGITGGFGSGKSTVTAMFQKLGAKCIDADAIAHELMEPGTELFKRVVATFGDEILDEGGKIDRRRLSLLIFSPQGDEKLRRLNTITHPKIVKVLKERMVREKGMVVVDAPLLLEVGLEKIMDKVVVVWASDELRIERLKKHRGLSEEEIRQRFSSQMALEEKLKFADYVVKNDGALAETSKQVELIWNELRNQI